VNRLRLRSRAGGGGETLVPFTWYPLDPDNYGPSKFYANRGISGTGVSISADGEQITIGATTGSLAITGNATMPITPSSTVVVWCRAVSGAPTTITARFLGSGGTAIGSTFNLSLQDGIYYSVLAAPGTAFFLSFAATNTGGSDVTISRPAVCVQGAVTLSNDEHGTLWLANQAGKQSGAGSAATLSGTVVTCPPNAVGYGRCQMNAVGGTSHVALVKVSDWKVAAVQARYGGSGANPVAILENFGGGWWGRIYSVPITGISTNLSMEVDNSTSSFYTAGTVTMDYIEVHEGTQYPSARANGEAPAGTYSKSVVVAKQLPGGINVFLPGSNAATSKAVRWQLRSYTGAPGSGTGWGIERIHEAIQTGPTTYAAGDQLTDVGEHRLAVREPGGNHLGSKTHGWEILDTVALTVDGVSTPIDGTSTHSCTSLVLSTTSTIKRDTDSVDLFDVETTFTFTAGYVDMHHRLTALVDMTLATCYTAMLSMARYLNADSTRNPIFTHYSYSPSYALVSILTAETHTTAQTRRMSGSQGISTEVDIYSGWSTSTGDSWNQLTGASVKDYFSPTGYFTSGGAAITTSQVIETTARIKVMTAN
jgi:hypothetical protein